jgi:hypothetical protein
MKRRQPVFVHGHDLTVDNCFVGKAIECSRYGRKSLAEILSVARREMRTAFTPEPDSPLAIEFELQLPLRAVRQVRDGEAKHRFEEASVHDRGVVVQIGNFWSNLSPMVGPPELIVTTHAGDWSRDRAPIRVL